MKLVKEKVNHHGCAGCIFDIKDDYCALDLLQALSGKDIDVKCYKINEVKYIFKLVEDNENEDGKG